jgi:hypothetical protein
MSAPLPIDGDTPHDRDDLVQVLDRFEDAWERGLAPRVEDYLSGAEGHSSVLVSLVHIDLERRLKASEPVRVESYLRRFPALEADPSVVLDLIEAEFTFRHRADPTLAAAEYLRRFPQYEGALRERLTTQSPTTTPDFPVSPGGPIQAPAGYEALEVLGRGGMGVVLLARDVRTGEQVAVKVLRPELRDAPQAVRMFQREAEHMARLQHPNILAVRTPAAGPAATYYVMPYLPRGPLGRLLQDQRPLSRAVILPILRQVAAALCFAHERGIIHRDIKPANVLLDAEGKAYLADFGLLRSLYNDSLLDVRRPQCLGTAPYMSPGVAAGQAEDVRCDIYSFGAVLYELLTGRPPYSGPDAGAVVAQVLHGPPEPIRRLNPAADEGLTRIAEGAMARALRDRYATMEDVLADLDRVAAGQAPLDPGARPRALRPRRRLLVASLVCLGLLALGALAAVVLMGKDGTPLAVVALQAEVFRGDSPAPVGRLGEGLSFARVDDQIRVTARLSRKAYCYLVALNADGTCAFCPEGDAGRAPGAVREIVYPPPGPTRFRLSDGRGMQGFVLAASSRPLKPFSAWLAEAGELPWAPARPRERPTQGWRFDGRNYRSLADPLRGQEANPDFPGPFEAVCSFLQQRGEFDAVHAITFPVRASAQ